MAISSFPPCSCLLVKVLSVQSRPKDCSILVVEFSDVSRCRPVSFTRACDRLYLRALTIDDNTLYWIDCFSVGVGVLFNGVVHHVLFIKETLAQATPIATSSPSSELIPNVTPKHYGLLSMSISAVEVVASNLRSYDGIWACLATSGSSDECSQHLWEWITTVLDSKDMPNSRECVVQNGIVVITDYCSTY